MIVSKTKQNIPSGWASTKVGDIGSTYSGLRSKSKSDFGHGSPFITYMNIFSNSKIDKNIFDLVNIGAGENQSRVKYGDVFFTVSSETPEEVGMSSVLLDEVGNYYLNSFCFGFRLNDFNLLTPQYARYLFRGQDFRSKIIKMAQGSTRFNLSKERVLSLDIILPPIQEQQKIAEILETVDEDIAKTREVIEATEKLKRGLMQSILSFGNKEKVKYLAFGDIGKVSMCKRIFKKETSDTGEIPFYKIGTFGKESDSFISQELYDSYRNKFPFPKIGDILLSASGTIGRKVKYDGRPAYFQDSNIIWLEHDESKILNSFLFHLYDTIKWQTEGSTIKRLYNDIFLKKIIPVPSISQQKQIVEILSAIDEKISVNKKLKAKLALLKKGLMQDLLSGDKRVKYER